MIPVSLRFCCLLFLLSAAGGMAVAAETDGSGEETMLMFVGEELDVLSIASRREESAWAAPAVAGVVTRREFREMGADTVRRALETFPGFYLNRRESGTRPYLRGVPESILWMYDAVPMSSDVRKSFHPIDRELSLAPIKRIEVVRGPGSVLWGPDAFAGIVNLTPLTGRDLNGAETGVWGGEPDRAKGAYVNFGRRRGPWDAFFSLSGRMDRGDDDPVTVVRFFGKGDVPVPPAERFGSETIGDAHYLEGFGRIAYEDWLTVTARLSDNRKPYRMRNGRAGESWEEVLHAPFSFVKLEARKDLRRNSALRFMASQTWLSSEWEVIDNRLRQKEATSYSELLYDRTLFTGRGLATAGFSYRYKDVSDAPIWDGYLPEFLGSENDLLLPVVTEENYETELWSFFGQYRHKLGDWDLFGGLRFDHHDSYEDHLSFNLGGVWSPWRTWVFKVLYGTAYRTPFARQLREEASPDLEEVQSLNLQAGWEPEDGWGTTVTGFWNRIDNHLLEDPYAGLSEPNHQNIFGVEARARFSPWSDLDLSAAVTLMDNSGPEETYRYNDFTFIRPDGTVEESFVDLDFPYDMGPDTLVDLVAVWRPTEDVTLRATAGYVSERDFVVLSDGEFERTRLGGRWLVDANLLVENLFRPGWEATLSVENLLDRRYKEPGTYGLVEGTPATVRVEVRKRW